MDEFSAKITAVLQTLSSDNGKRDVMLDSCGLFGRGEVLTGGLEEVHRSLIFE